MKQINVIFLILIMSGNAFAYQRGYVVRTTSGNVIIPLNSGNQQNQQLKGDGMVFVTTVDVQTKKETDPVTQKEVEKIILKSYIRGCNQVTLPSKKDMDKSVRQGDHIEIRFDQPGSCTVIDWKKL